MTADERKGLKEHIEQCSGDLNELLERPTRLPPVQRFDEDQGVSALRVQSSVHERNPEGQPSKVPTREP